MLELSGTDGETLLCISSKGTLDAVTYSVDVMVGERMSDIRTVTSSQLSSQAKYCPLKTYNESGSRNGFKQS